MRIKSSWKSLPYILLAAYVVFIIYSMYQFKMRMDYVLENPVRVNGEVREMITRLREMRTSLPAIWSNPELSYEQMEHELKRQEDFQDESFKEAQERFTGDPQLLANLRKEFIEIRKLRREGSKTHLGNNDYAKALNYYKEKIVPQVNLVYDAMSDISSAATEQMFETRRRIENEVIFNVIITIIVGLLIALAFMLINHQDKLRGRQLEERDKLFNQLSQNVDEIFIIARDAFNFDFVTDNSKRLLGISATGIVEDPGLLYSFLPPDDSTWLENKLNNTDSTLSEDENNVIVKKDAQIFRLICHPITGSQTPTKFIVSIQDQTREFQHQQALSDALENAHAASMAKSSFLSHMSHEIRTPMNAIIGMTTIALSKINDIVRVEDCLLKIGESSKHLLGLINDVLDMSKIENGKFSLSHEPFSLPRSIQNLNDIVRPQAVARKINFEIAQENVDEEELIGDSLRLNQILLNILSNALKFTPADGTIFLKIQQIMKNQNNVRLRFIISDTGIGMSREFLKRIYQPFEQANDSATSKYGGTGLGMAITLNLITLMGGSINVESEEGIGTTFIVELPFGIKENSAHNAGDLPPLKVLVVDDDKGTCEHATLLLEKLGLFPHWCTSGQQAIALVEEAHNAGAGYDVCFIDWKMPEMDGAETAKRIREVAGDDLLIIIISAYDWSPIEDKARQSGVNEFVAKPFFASTLYNVLLNTSQRYGIVKGALENEESTQYDFTGKRVLLVEDNEFNREIGEEFLDMVNATVENAENGKEALDKFLASTPGYYDIILMDVQMPVMDGYEATKNIRASNHPDSRIIPILAMTANAFSEDVANAVASGMNGHIAKPIDVNELYQKMKTHLEKKPATV